MSSSMFLRQGLRSLRPLWRFKTCLVCPLGGYCLSVSGARFILPKTGFQKDDGEPHDGALANGQGSQRGSLARVDSTVQVEYPKVGEVLPSGAVQGRCGQHFKRTLPSFSLEGRVGVVTGGSRGLGLVMSQALVISGANIAIVDLNSMFQCAD